MASAITRARRLAARVKKAAHFDHHAFWRKRPIRSGTVMYESFSGNGMLDNPEAIFRYLLDAPEFAGLEHVWVLSDLERYASTVAEFRGRRNVRFVRYRSPAYFQALATSEFLINNATFPPEFGKRPGQVYVNTWHGTPLKKMGYDMPDGAREAANTLRNFMQADYLLAQNPFMAEQMYEKAYRLANLFDGLIIEEGYPRVDRQRLGEEAYLAARRRLEAAGVQLGGREIVLYAPTWKGDSFSDPRDDIEQLVRTVADLQAELGERYVVLLKTHQIVHSFAAGYPGLENVLVPNELPTNVVLGIASALATDYSSIFFDMLATGRPIVFYTPDLGDYADGRGLYLPPSEWPGAVCRTVPELATALRDSLSGTARHERYDEWQARFTPFDDGAATQRVVDVVFRSRRHGYRVRSAQADERIRVLFYLGGMSSNGITASALSLLNTIDHSRYDVSVITTASKRGQQRANQAKIHQAVRQFLRSGGMNGSKLDHVRRKLAERGGRGDAHLVDPRQRALWDAEWARCFGGGRFDVVIDFSGYSPFWATLLLHSPMATRAIWLHNEMAPEVHRTRHMSRTLPALFELYKEFDHLVAVSPRLRDLNAAELARYAPADRFVVVRNVIEPERVRALAAEELPTELDEDGCAEIPEWETRMQHSDGIHWFVNVGRLSPEKNQRRLIDAFAAVRAQRDDVGLLIVGSGPLRDDLQRHVDATGLGDRVFLTGAQDNPFAIMARSECFVLSSDYEGQPMVLLEAAALRLPIVTTAFASVVDAVPGSGIHITERSPESLADGMRAYLHGSVAPATVDSGYAEEVRRQFAALTDLPQLASGAAA